MLDVALSLLLLAYLLLLVGRVIQRGNGRTLR